MLHISTLGRTALLLAAFLIGATLLAEEPRPRAEGDGGGNNGLLARLLARFDELDANKDGALDLAELTKALGAAQAKAALQAGDKDGDGKLSRAEYNAWVRPFAQQQPKPRGEGQGKPRVPGRG
jgi:hypothetical protein